MGRRWGGTTNGLLFDADGAVRFRCGGLGSLTTIRPAGPLLFEAGERVLIEIDITPTLARVFVNETLIGSVSGTNLKHDFNRLMDGGVLSTGWQGVIYSAQYLENDTPAHLWKFDEGSGLSGGDSIGSLQATIGGGLTWVNA